MIKVLHVLSSLGGGGVEKMLYSYYKSIHTNALNIAFDFIVHDAEEGMLEDDLLQWGCHIFHVVSKHQNPIQNILQIHNIIKTGCYDIVQAHQNFSSVNVLFSAKMCRVPVRILHAHGCAPEKSIRDRAIHQGIRVVNALCATEQWACGSAAATWLFGSKHFKSPHFQIIPNAIETENFSFSSQYRKEYREKLHWSKKVVLQIGRLSPEKNHLFTIKIAEAILKERDDFRFVIIGEGDMRELLENEIAEKNLKPHFLFMGERRDVAQLMSAADVLIFPSKNEGFGIVALEAQANGLPCLASDKVPAEVKLCETLVFRSLVDSAEEWCSTLITLSEMQHDVNAWRHVKQLGYDVDTQVAHIVNLYRSVANKKGN